MSYSAQDIARYIVNYSYDQKKPVSNLKLQKMLYFAWVDYYKSTKTVLFYDDICAWQLGPVVPETYYEFCSYGGRPITENYNVEIDNDDKKIIDNIIKKYLPVAASTLVSRTHAKGTPWSITFNEGFGLREVIPFKLIEEKECA